MTAGSSMSAQATQVLDSALPTVHLTLNGQEMSRELFEAIDEITVDSSLNLPAVATITLRDPLATLLDDDTFRLGTALKVVAEVGDVKGTLFDGEVVELEPRFAEATQVLRLRAFDRLHRLMRGTHTRSFQNVSDLDLVKKLGAEVGLKAQTDGPSVVHPFVLQRQQSNLAFLRERAERLGLLLFAEGQTLHCQPLKGQEVTEVTWGQNLLSFSPRLTSLGQTSGSVVRSWNPQRKEAVVGQARAGQGKPQVEEKSKSEGVSQQAFSMGSEETSGRVVVRDQAYADAIVKAQRNRVTEGLLEARGVTGGLPKLLAGSRLKIRNVGKRYAGEYVVSSVRHVYRNARGYFTEFTVSGSQETTLPALLASAGGRGPGRQASAPMIGVVTNNDDPDNLGRVKLKLPALADDCETDWARVVNQGGGPGRGTQFLPEVNDEVLVAFEQGDLHYPYVLGALWNGKDAPPLKASEAVSGGKVHRRVIRSRSGHELSLRDQGGSADPDVTLKTGGGHTLTLLDAASAPSVKLKSTGGQTLTMQDGGSPRITLEDASGNRITIDTGSGTIKISSLARIELSAQAGITVDGGAGDVTIKGTLIRLN